MSLLTCSRWKNMVLHNPVWVLSMSNIMILYCVLLSLLWFIVTFYILIGSFYEALSFQHYWLHYSRTTRSIEKYSCDYHNCCQKLKVIMLTRNFDLLASASSCTLFQVFLRNVTQNQLPFRVYLICVPLSWKELGAWFLLFLTKAITITFHTGSKLPLHAIV